eukprot:g65859.t1
MSKRVNRKNDRLEKLRAKLKKRHASLADDFDYLLYYVIFLKDEKQQPLIFQAEKVGLSMTNNQERAIMEGVTARAYSVKEANDLLVRDTVQIHAARWIPVNHAAIQSVGHMSVVDIDFAVWPRADLYSIEVLCFTRWKTIGSAPYELVNLHFSMSHDRELTKSIIPYLVKCIKGKHEKKGGILFNTAQNLGVWVSPRYVKNSLTMSMTSMMLCFPQDELTSWDSDVTIPGDTVGEDRLLDIIHKTKRGRARLDVETLVSETPTASPSDEVGDGLLRSLVELRLGCQQPESKASEPSSLPSTSSSCSPSCPPSCPSCSSKPVASPLEASLPPSVPFLSRDTPTMVALALAAIEVDIPVPAETFLPEASDDPAGSGWWANGDSAISRSTQRRMARHANGTGPDAP